MSCRRKWHRKTVALYLPVLLSDMIAVVDTDDKFLFRAFETNQDQILYLIRFCVSGLS